MMNCDVLICGAGVPGMAAAKILAGAGLRVVLVDAGGVPAPYDAGKPDGRTIALMNPSIATLKRAQMWQNVQGHASPLKNMSVVDDSQYPKGTPLVQTFKSQELGEDCFGWNAPLTALRAAFLGDDLTFLTGVRLQSLKDGVAVLDNGQAITARLVIGADGKASAVRNLSGIEVNQRGYGQSAMVCVIGHSLPHGDTSTEFHRPGGPFTLVPMQGNQSAIVWVEYEADAQRFLSLPRPAFEAAVAERTRGQLGVITLLSNPASFALEYMRAKSLTAPRVALVAEAAHSLSPIGAQGMNLSLRDVADLCDLVIDAQASGLDIGGATLLAAYEKLRKPDLLTRTTAIDIANRTVASDSKLLRFLRRGALQALSLPTPLRRLAMKSGLSA